MGSNTDFRTLQGGQWHDYACNGNDYGLTYRSVSKVDLQLWLTDVNGKDSGLVKRGFSGLTLTNKKGSEVASTIQTIIKHDTPGPLQKALSYLLFSCPWDPSLLGHACLFLSKFCSMVGSDYLQEGETFNQYKEKFERKFNGSFDEMQKRCNEVNNGLTPFLIGSDSKLSAVCQRNTGLFNDLWDDGKFEDYVKWLKENLKNIIDALKAMSKDCKTWGSPHSFEMGLTAGPFRFGFVPKDNKWQDYVTKGNLQGPIKGLIASLRQLKEYIDTASSGSSSSSAGATAGGVFTGILGTGGLGAGAAYATNAFGFQNLITSFISSFLK